MSTRALNPRHGPHAPITGAAPRTAGSVRRTSTVDNLRPEGVGGPVVLRARGRDLATTSDGSAVVLDSARVDAVAEDGVLTALESEPRRDLSALVGARVGSGFRRRLAEVVPEEVAGRTLLHLLLDDLVGAALTGGLARTESMRGVAVDRAALTRLAVQEDLCAGWRAGGSIMLQIGRGVAPVDVTGPPAPPLADDDPHGWHAMDPLEPVQTRRARRLDVSPRPGEPGDLAADAYFRDSWMDSTGAHSVVHEYTVTAAISDGIVVEAAAVPRTLPWVECPDAAGSAAWIVGTPAEELRARVRTALTGIGTCTHLNDVLRSLEDVPSLARLAALGARPT